MDAVIVSYNSSADLQRQLDCLPLRAAFDRIVVVDNASGDDSVAVAETAGVEVIRRYGNDGLAAAINAGVADTDAELIAVLNPDILVDDVALIDRLEAAFADPSVGLVAPALVLPDGSLQDSARHVPSPTQLVSRRITGGTNGAVGRAAAPGDVPWVVGAFFVVRRAAFESVGGFDTRYALYFEDVDFCVRLWSSGWRVQLDPSVRGRHEHQAASRRSWFGPAMRHHVSSAVKFFSHHPDLLLESGRRRLVRASHGIDRTSPVRSSSHDLPRVPV